MIAAMATTATTKTANQCLKTKPTISADSHTTTNPIRTKTTTATTRWVVFVGSLIGAYPDVVSRILFGPDNTHDKARQSESIREQPCLHVRKEQRSVRLGDKNQQQEH